MTFCVNPWMTVHVKFDQGVSPCCLFKQTYPIQDLTEYSHSQELKEIKTRLLNGEKIAECSVCWQHEERGYDSKRLRDNKKYQHIFQNKFKNVMQDNSGFFEYYIRLGNYCNIRCTTCGDGLSTSWISENKRFGVPTYLPKLLSATNPVWQHIVENAHDCGAIEFIGGEPFMMHANLQAKLMNDLIEAGHAHHIRLKYNTNGTKLPTEQLDYWSQFDSIELNISIDGVGDRFEYLRYPANWDEVQRNLIFYKDTQQRVPGLELTVIHTLSIFNVGYIKQMVDYCHEQNLNLWINLVENPQLLNFYNSPQKVKDWIVDQIKDINLKEVQKIVTNIHKEYQPTTAKKILEFAKTLDSRRGLSIEQTFPELYQVLCLS